MANNNLLFGIVFSISGGIILFRASHFLYSKQLSEHTYPYTLDQLLIIEPQARPQNEWSMIIFLIASCIAGFFEAITSTFFYIKDKRILGNLPNYILGINLIIFTSLFLFLFFQFTIVFEQFFELIGINLLLIFIFTLVNFVQRRFPRVSGAGARNEYSNDNHHHHHHNNNSFYQTYNNDLDKLNNNDKSNGHAISIINEK